MKEAERTTLYLVWILRETGDHGDRAASLVGVYRSQSDAWAEIMRRGKTAPVNFTMHGRDLGSVDWQDGFVSWEEDAADPIAPPERIQTTPRQVVDEEDWDGRSVFVTCYIRPVVDDGIPDGKVIGVFGSEAAAREAINLVSNEPGFRDDPSGFRTLEYRLGEYCSLSEVGPMLTEDRRRAQ